MKTIFQRLTERLTFRLFISHVVVAVLTGFCLTLLLFGFIWHATKNPYIEMYQVVALNYGMMWMTGMPDGLPSDLMIDPMPGWTLVVSAEDEILWGRGDTTCRAGTSAADCPELLQLAGADGFFERDGKLLAAVEIPLITGDKIITERGQITAEPYLIYGDFVLTGYASLLWFELISRGLMAIPIALLLAWLFMRPEVKRLSIITQASRRFAQGDLNARAHDHREDEVGDLDYDERQKKRRGEKN